MMDKHIEGSFRVENLLVLNVLVINFDLMEVFPEKSCPLPRTESTKVVSLTPNRRPRI